MSNRWRAGIASVVIVLVIAAGYRWWTRDERAIRNRMSAIAQSLTVTGNEGTLGTVTRLATLRNALAPDIRVSAGPPAAAAYGADAWTPQEIVGRDTVLAMVSRWVPPPGGVAVEFVDVQVHVDAGRAAARVYCTATVTSRGPSEPPTVDARELTIRFTNVEGAWLVSSVRPEETLAR